MYPEVVRRLHGIEFTVVASVYDQGATNEKAMKELIKESKNKALEDNKNYCENTIVIDDREIVHLFDCPHLLQCLRNNLITKDLLFTWKDKKGKASWTHLERAFTVDKYGGMFRLFRKLLEANIHPNNKQKMRVQLCKSFFSHTTASILINMCRSKKKCLDETLEIKPEEEDTGYLFHIVDNIFNSMNGEGKFTQKRINLDAEGEESIYKTLIPTSGECPHEELWDEAIVLFENMKFVKNTPKAKERPNVVNNFVHTLKSFKVLRK